MVVPLRGVEWPLCGKEGSAVMQMFIFSAFQRYAGRIDLPTLSLRAQSGRLNSPLRTVLSLSSFLPRFLSFYLSLCVLLLTADFLVFM